MKALGYVGLALLIPISAVLMVALLVGIHVFAAVLPDKHPKPKSVPRVVDVRGTLEAIYFMPCILWGAFCLAIACLRGWEWES